MNFPVELGLIILFSILGGVFAVRFKQPAVLGLILVGAVIGPNALGIIHDVSLVEIAIEVGAVLLMFTIGTEFSLSRLLKLGTRVIVIAGTKIGLAFLVVYYTSVLLGFNTITSLYLGVILSITSTVILVKILEGKGFSKNKEFKLLIAILILEDIFGVFALTFFSNLNSNVDLQPFNLIADIMFSLTVLVIAYFVLQKLLKPFISWLIKYSTEDTITFTSLGLCGGMTYTA
jgi:CPA2 family monovalent cation:H+ antiporter-2